MVHYVILLGGFFIALAALGVDLAKVTILAGAFTVGVDGSEVIVPNGIIIATN